jgi:catechol 2,3-dioxygenase-like lactoylglutathione lyase family enzyme
VLDALTHLALEVKYLDRARSFYEERLGLTPARVDDREVAYEVGATTLICRRPRGVPRGGLHVHYACHAAGPLAAWRDRLAPLSPASVDFGSYTSLYVDDPDDHCFEVGGTDADGQPSGADPDPDPDPAPELEGVFEVVLEVESLSAAEPRYRSLGFEPVDRGEDRRRVRLSGPVDLELWEPHLGLADARGAVHADVGFATSSVDEAVAAADWAVDRVDRRDDDGVGRGVRVRDPDGHWLTFTDPDG